VTAVRYEFGAGASRLTLAAPERGNSLDPETAEDLQQAVRRARQDDARVVVLRSEGRAFSVGGDVGSFAAADDRERLVDDLAETLHRTISHLHRMDAVVLAVVQGVAAGAGVALAAAADVVLAGESARFTLAYTKVGLSPDGGSSLLPRSACTGRCIWPCSTRCCRRSRRGPQGWSPRCIRMATSRPRPTASSPSCSPDRVRPRSPRRD
jgi:2-(1,2-epoxy-1,2-dihydrophenyl)acetyl-CoA isomerase